MDATRKIQLLDEQIVAAQGGRPADLDRWLNDTEVVLRMVLGDSTPVYRRFKEVRYSPSVFVPGQTDFAPYRAAGVREAMTVLEAAKKEIRLAEEVAQAVESPRSGPAAEFGSQIFIVHGRDNAAKENLARFLLALTGAEPVILHEQPNLGQVLIEKFENTAANTGFAIALLTADDVGRLADADPSEDRKRARQNVVFELGFFFGAIGRQRTAVLIDEGVERPSDIDGLVYVIRDAAGGWRAEIASELEAVGIPVDWKALGKKR